jgi:hypothetical protein
MELVLTDTLWKVDEMSKKKIYGPWVAENQCSKEPREVNLWRHIILRAINDLNRKKYKDSAEMFLFSNLPAYREWREEVFFYAKLEVPERRVYGFQKRD